MSGDMPIASFRDPAGFVIAKDKRIFRVVRPDGAKDLFDFLETSTVRERIAQGGFIWSRTADPEDRREVLRIAAPAGASSDCVVLEHDAIWFPSYPYEWPSSMLAAAAVATLDLADGLLPDGLGLKDATPYNVLFRGPQPVFVDAMSIERREATDPIWRPTDQFLRTFAYPLIWEQCTGTRSGEVLQTRREGVPLADLYRQLGWRQRLRFLRWVCLPQWLSSQSQGHESYEVLRRDAEVARMSLRSTSKSLRKLISNVAPVPKEDSAWSDYSVHCHYDAESREKKRQFVTDALPRDGRLLDLGANDGEYSLLAESRGNAVVACDLDAACVDRLWRLAAAQNRDILPLVVNLANPSPAMGWGNAETRSFLARAKSADFECVLMLALLHHLTVTERVPTSFVLQLAASLTRDRLVIEWVSPEDPYYQRLLRGRQDLHRDDTREAFEAACLERFDIENRMALMQGRRWMYSLRLRCNA